MRKAFFLSKAFFLLFFVVRPAGGAEIQVPEDQPTIAAAVAAAADGDTISLGPGTWNETVDFAGKNLTLTGREGALKTVIDPQGAGSCIVVASGETAASVSRLTLTGGSAENGGGVSVTSGNLTLMNVMIHSCTAVSAGGGVFVAGADAGCTIVSSTVTGNSVTAADGGGGLAGPESGVVVLDTIVWGNSANEVADDIAGIPASAFTSCLIGEPGFDGSQGNITGEPGFLDAASGDFRLSCDSPCIDAGSDAGAPADAAGAPRVDDPDVADTGTGSETFFDIGAFEHQALRPAGVSCAAESGRVTLTWTDPVTYDSLTITRNGEEAAVLEGTETTWSEEAEGDLTYEISGTVGGAPSCSVACSILVPPKPLDFTCVENEGTVVLTWTDGSPDYTAVVVKRNGEEIGTAEPGAGTYTDTIAGPGTYEYAISGRIGEAASSPVICTVESDFLPAPEDLVCSVLGRRVTLEWTNPVSYDGIRIVRDGTEISDLPGDQQSYRELVEEFGTHEYRVVGTVGEWQGASEACSVVVEGVAFVRGDSNASGRVDLADIIFILSYLFRSGETPPCLDAANVNGDIAIDISDAIYMLNYIFNHAAPPKPPFPDCGTIPKEESIGCESFSACERL